MPARGWAITAAAALAAGCSAGKPATADNLRCAAYVSVADQLMTTGALTPDPGFQKQAPAAGMTHVNAYAISSGKSEREAFEAVRREAAEVGAGAPPDRVVREARRCVEEAQALLKRGA